jgi:formylglycine-generating enzyme
MPVNDMVWIPGATFLMGSDRHYPEEAPERKVTVGGFWIDARPVTNREFERFVRKTRHVTLAERAPDPADYPGARPELLVPFSSVFVAPPHPVSLADPYQWWRPVPGADWRHPQGRGSSIRNKPDHPVVHVAWSDVAAYAAWETKEIPTEAEWELAARGGLDGAEFAWGDELTPDDRWMANTWQGEFPVRNTRDDGYEGTSPAGIFPANGYGLYDMIGNVWEWTSDWYAGHADGASPCCGGAARERSADRSDPARIPRKVMKGGSHLCAPNYCRRYRPAARMAQPIDTSTSHLGFRCVIRETLPALQAGDSLRREDDTEHAEDGQVHGALAVGQPGPVRTAPVVYPVRPLHSQRHLSVPRCHPGRTLNRTHCLGPGAAKLTAPRPR